MNDIARRGGNNARVDISHQHFSARKDEFEWTRMLCDSGSRVS